MLQEKAIDNIMAESWKKIRGSPYRSGMKTWVGCLVHPMKLLKWHEKGCFGIHVMFHAILRRARVVLPKTLWPGLWAEPRFPRQP